MVIDKVIKSIDTSNMEMEEKMDTNVIPRPRITSNHFQNPLKNVDIPEQQKEYHKFGSLEWFIQHKNLTITFLIGSTIYLFLLFIGIINELIKIRELS
jgi:hypothetical protein